MLEITNKLLFPLVDIMSLTKINISSTDIFICLVHWIRSTVPAPKNLSHLHFVEAKKQLELRCFELTKDPVCVLKEFEYTFVHISELFLVGSKYLDGSTNVK